MNHLQLDPPKYRVHPNLLLQLSITLFGCLGPQTFASSSSFITAPFFLQPPTKLLNKNLRENQELFFLHHWRKNFEYIFWKCLLRVDFDKALEFWRYPFDPLPIAQQKHHAIRVGAWTSLWQRMRLSPRRVFFFRCHRYSHSGQQKILDI